MHDAEGQEERGCMDGKRKEAALCSQNWFLFRALGIIGNGEQHTHPIPFNLRSSIGAENKPTGLDTEENDSFNLLK